jgi:anti-sigma factor RsiW
MPCAESLQVQAYVDGEVDALAAAAVERHMEQCAECRALHQELLRLRNALRDELPYTQTPPALRARIMRDLDQESAPASRARQRTHGIWRTRSFWLGAVSGLGSAAVAAALAFVMIASPFKSAMIDELLGAHVSSLMSSHLLDVVSTDKHTVKPWFAGHTDVSPEVADFESQGFKLIGGRVDYLEHQRAAVVVYQHGAHVINVFSWADGRQSLPGKVTRNGYHFICWRAGDLDNCAVSDTAWDELQEMVRLVQGASALEQR